LTFLRRGRPLVGNSDLLGHRHLGHLEMREYLDLLDHLNSIPLPWHRNNSPVFKILRSGSLTSPLVWKLKASRKTNKNSKPFSSSALRWEDWLTS